MKRRPARAQFRPTPAAEALALDPGGSGVLARALQGKSPSPHAFDGFFDCPSPLCFEPGEILDGGIAVLCLEGPIEHHRSELWHSYEDLAAEVAKAADHDQVKKLVLKIDSPGGVAAGMGEMHRAIRRISARTGKPIYAYADELAASAAYHLASACTEIWLPESGHVGSVGVILCTVDETRRLKKAGVAVRYVVTGARKADLHPGAPVTQDVLDVAQAKVDKLGGFFFRAVARARAGTPLDTPEKVEALQAAVYIGQDAVDVGLADGVAGWEKFLDLVRSVEPGGGPMRGGGGGSSRSRAVARSSVACTVSGHPQAALKARAPKAKAMKTKLLQLTKAAADAKAAAEKALQALAGAKIGEKAKLLKAAKDAQALKEKADLALASAKAKMMKKKTRYVEETEEEEGTPAAEEEEEEEEDDDDGDDDDSDDDEEEEEEEAESEEEEEEAESEEEEEEAEEVAEEEEASATAKKARAAAQRAYLKAIDGHPREQELLRLSPFALYRLAQKATGQKSVEAAFGALSQVGPRLKVAQRADARLARLEKRDRTARVDAILDRAKAKGRAMSPALRASLRDDGLTLGPKWLKGKVALLPKVRTMDEGEIVPRTGADGEPLGAPTESAQKMDAAFMAGLSPKEQELARAEYAKISEKKAAKKRATF